MSGDRGLCVPRATYRLQFHKDFGFDAAASVASYLARLGISHVYASPYLKARPGSTHGYDIVDHDALNPELGGAEAFLRMVDALHRNGLSQVLDFVPNHMGVGGADNPLWLNVLEWGPDSEYAGWFDIDWDPDRRYLHEKVLVPLLADQYGIELERGNLRLQFDTDDGSFAVWAYEKHKLPISPLHYQRILGDTHSDLERLGDAFAGLPEWRPQIGRRANELKAELGLLARTDPRVRQEIAGAVERLNGAPGDLLSWAELDRLIDAQYWRAAHFRVAASDINYRRFFNINDLAGLRMELPEVFERTHRLLFHLVGDGIVTGVRIDHIDGLLDPKDYLCRLREKAPRSDFYLVVEKILARNEELHLDWPVQGTTGYDFANLVLGLLIDPRGEEALSLIYSAFTGSRADFAEIVRESKLRIMRHEMASELNVLTRDAARAARQNPRTADFTRTLLGRGLRAIVASFPVYRTYLDASGDPGEAGRRNLDTAIALARRCETDVDSSVYDFLHKLLSGDLVAAPRSGFSRNSVLRCAMKFQQFSGPVMAKGLEDTAFYRYNRFVALNEVGGNPDVFGISLAHFHEANGVRLKHWRHAMLGTATHDTKRGEDTRARLAVLAELAEEWGERVDHWSRLVRNACASSVGGRLSRNDEYLFYQLLVGTWPVELLDGANGDALRSYAARIQGAMLKSVREAKLHSSWAAPDAAYEEATSSFVATTFDPVRAADFHADFLPFAAEIARLGARNTLTQTVLKLTLPGVPDLYQGTELWDLSLVDPDNRRAVDYELRARLLEEVQGELAVNRQDAIQRYMSSWRDGRFKLAAVATLLGYRRDREALFQDSDYEALSADGPKADHICSFLRTAGQDRVLVAVVRFPARWEAAPDDRPTTIALAKPCRSRAWRDLLSGKTHTAAELHAQELFRILPAAVLVPA
ncbi:MAG TPA: malto-oligosyltrehalose synthase [Stellaceae bacterium]|nr:malto-oligosyltrehalose synthase [Stellaceae bacterium]